MVELVRHQLPAGVLLAHPVVDRHSDIGVVGGAGAGPGHGVHRGPGEALGVGGHDQHRDTAVFLGLGIGAHRQPYVVGVLDQAGPHLLAVDQVFLAVADRRGAQRSQVGSGARLRVADREVNIAASDARQVERLLLLGPEGHDSRGDAVDGQERHRCAGDGGLVGEDQLIHRRAGLAAVLGRPAQCQPSVAAHLGHRLPVDVAAAVLTGGRHQGFPAPRCHQGVEVGPQFAAQLLLFRGVADPHSCDLRLDNDSR